MISSEGVKVILNTVYTFIELLALLLSVFGNLLVIYVRRKKLKTKSNCYIVSVAIADLVNGSLGISFNLFTVRIMKVTKQSISFKKFILSCWVNHGMPISVSRCIQRFLLFSLLQYSLWWRCRSIGTSRYAIPCLTTRK